MKIAIKNTAHIGKAIKLTRLGQGLDQLAAAGLAGAGQSFLSHLENGKDTAQIGKVLEVLTSLGIRVELTLPDEVVNYIDTHLPADAEESNKHSQHLTASTTRRRKSDRTPFTPLISQSGNKPSVTALDADTLFKRIAPLYVKRVTR